MPSSIRSFAATFATLTSLVACVGLGTRDTVDPEVAEDMEAIEPTSFASEVAVDPALQLEAAGPPPMASGSGLQVLQVSPQGVDRKALQVAVVFDRPMVALTELDTMAESVPLSCDGDVRVSARWAGTTTAVLRPDNAQKAFPRGTSFTCTVPAGTKAVDGTALERTITWSFETPRPRVTFTSPGANAKDWKLDTPFVVRFDQPVDAAVVAPHLAVTDADGRPVPILAVAQDGETAVTITHAALSPNTGYTLTVQPGIGGVEGPLTSREPLAVSFRTYPPLTLQEFGPSGEGIDPIQTLELDFSTRVAPDEVSSRLTLDPAPIDGWAPPEGTYPSRVWRYGVRMLPRTTYTVALAPGVRDEHGQALDGRAWTFTTGDYQPWLHVGTDTKLYAANNPPELPLRHLNVGRLDVRIGRVPDGRVPFDARGWLDGADLLPPDADLLRVPVEDEPNRVEIDTLDLRPYLRDGRGIVAYEITSPDLRYDASPRTYEGVLLVTDLSATLKLSPDALETWVTRLSDGRPVEGAEVEMYVGVKPVATGRTGADGLARFEGPLPADWDRWESDARVWVVARLGADQTITNHQAQDGIEPYQFGIWSEWDRDGQEAVAHGFVDRGVYRPGDPVHARATFRLQTAKGLELPTGQATWSFSDPQGASLAEGKATLDDRGGVSIDVSLPADGMLGDYTLRIDAEGEGWTRSEWLNVPARAYRPPAFRVNVDGPSEGVAGQHVTATADARYLFGSPLSKGEVFWRTWSQPRWFRPDGWDGYSFGPEYHWWEDDAPYEAEVGPSERMDLAEGRSAFGMDLPRPDSGRPVDWFLEAEVTDADRQAIADRVKVLVHPSEWYLGIKAGARMPTAGQETTVSVVAVQADGGPHAGSPAEVRVVRRTWNRVREKGMDGHWTWVHQPVDEEVARHVLTATGAAQEVAFTPPEPGYYRIEASGTDSRGNPVRASDALYVTGAGFASWALSEDNKLELVPDKRTYRAGDTARILVKTPRPGLSALVTLERQGVLWREVVQLEGTASVVEVPIGHEHKPNVFVSVLAVTGEGPQDAPDKGRPEVRVGLLELEVDAEEEHLAVLIRTDAEAYRPRDTVDVTVAVSRDGQRVAGAGVTLYAVDEAILSLTAYETPDAHEAMYQHHGYGTITADSRVMVLDRAPYLTKGAPRGGGGGDEAGDGPEMRSRFLTTIAWLPDLRTGADGTVRATIDLPDNLTTFRIMAVADMDATGFGSAEREIRVSRPLIARPALPRFLRVGDTAFGGIVVHNNTDGDRVVDVSASVEGPVDLAGAPLTVDVPAHGALEVPFRLKGLDSGDATFTFTVASGADRDAVQWPIPVRRDLHFETVATAGTTVDRAVERIARPDVAMPGFGGLEVDIASTVLVGAGEGLSYLVNYPHGCVEQITSRAMGSLYALQIREAAGIETPEDVLRANVDGVLGDLRKYRHWSGGLSYWPGATDPSVMGTAYAVELMGRAREAGFQVPDEELDERVAFLRDVLNGRHVPRAWDRLESLSAQAYVAVALARAGAGDTGHHNNLFARRADLTVLGQASLLEAIARTTGPDGRTSELERSILGRTTIEAASASVKENAGSRWARLWGSDDLSSAAALEALLVANGNHALAPKFARHLTSSRTHGRWHNTRATAGVLAALARYASAYEARGEAFDVEVTLAGKALVQQALAVPAAAHVALPMGSVSNGDLVVSSSNGGRLYYDARLRYVPNDHEARDEGFTLRRSYEILDGGGENGQVTSGAVLRVTLQVVTPVRRHAVAVVDPLPAGLEPVESSFATTSQAPGNDGWDEGVEDEGFEELPQYGGSWVFDHSEVRDDQVRLYASDLPPGIHTWRYVVRATTPGNFEHPPATVEAMYEPEIFGRTGAGTFMVGRGPTTP